MNLDKIKQALIANGLIRPDATDEQAAAAANSLQQTNPAALQQMAGGMSWLTIIGLGAGAFAVYLVWSHYSKTKKLGEVEQPEPDSRHQLRGFTKSLARFKGRPAGCRPLGRGGRGLGRARGLGDTEKYEFEPEIRLEGLRRGKRSRR